MRNRIVSVVAVVAMATAGQLSVATPAQALAPVITSFDSWDDPVTVGGTGKTISFYVDGQGWRYQWWGVEVSSKDFTIVANSCLVGRNPTGCTVEVAFTPKSVGDKYEQLAVYWLDGGTLQTSAVAARLFGTAVAAPTPADVTVSPATFEFANTIVGSDSVEQRFTLTNSGETDATYEVPGLTSGAANFSDYNTCGPGPWQLYAGDSCWVGIRFTSTALGRLEGNYRFVWDGNTINVPLAGTGVVGGLTSPPQTPLTPQTPASGGEGGATTAPTPAPSAPAALLPAPAALLPATVTPSVRTVVWKVSKTGKRVKVASGSTAGLTGQAAVFTENVENPAKATKAVVARVRALAERYDGVYGGVVPSKWTEPRIVAAYHN